MQRYSWRLWLVLGIVAVASVVLTPETAQAEPGNCRGEIQFIGSYYSGSEFAGGTGQLSYATEGFGPCLDDVQGLVLSIGGFVCAEEAIPRGTLGVAYVWFSWRVWWNEEEQTSGGPVLQQYDCGHVSFL